jgi:hypothetical protein
MSDYKKYLPSKTFTTRILFIVVCIVLFFTVRGIISFFKNKEAKKSEPVQMTVGTLIQKDSNDNGIPDWEEYLWGLDPYKNGQENKDLILAKKNTLLKNGEIQPMDDSKAISENEMLSQEFFATIIALQQTGQLDETSMKSVSEAVGKNIETTPIPDIYTRNMLTIKNDSTLTETTYKENLTALINKYSDADIGNELTFIVQGLSNNDPQALYAAKTVADAYQSFGREFIKIPVPQSLVQAHLSAANNYEKVGQAIKDLAQILSDPLIGMKAIINYKNYSDALANDLEKVSEILQ